MARTITRDVIAQVSGPGWNYGLARILIDDSGTAAVFVPPATNGPVYTFTTNLTQPGRGTGITEDGGQVSWRRRGSGCGFKLANCQISREELAEYWV